MSEERSADEAPGDDRSRLPTALIDEPVQDLPPPDDGTTDGERRRHLVLVHGHGRKPLAGELENLWRSALQQGLARDHGRKLARLRRVQVSFSYYGDLTRGERPRSADIDEDLDLADRYAGLVELSRRDSKKQFRSHHYFRLRGRSSIRRRAMFVAAPLARALRADDALIARVSPELARYRRDPAFADALRARVMEMLAPALEAGDDVFVVAHCLGSVVAYDCLWALSQAPLPRPKVSGFLTLGSPLAVDAVRARLCGADEPIMSRYPTNIATWFNVAAQDDYVCHDPTVANDFAPMLGRRMISRIEDIGVFNFARRYGRSNPHNDVGYLIHPKTVGVLADWLKR